MGRVKKNFSIAQHHRLRFLWINLIALLAHIGLSSADYGGKCPEANVLVYSCGSGRDSSLNIFHLLKSYSSLCVPFSVGAVRPDGTETQKFM
ncbi:hypothetical protein OUZ56_008905 [Daphnia magna]|uniref:Uncharacterized protein n=1 Tax=Daphnia magna TaxID=35525 RepID=A0ABR0AEM7_9CRUS|nr:hypothetical protein OUZ56_008905 [Daphnia magna]